MAEGIFAPKLAGPDQGRNVVPIADPGVQAVFDACNPRLRECLLRLRRLILVTAAETSGIGALIETLKWRDPAYLPAAPRTGTTIRINALKGSGDRYAAYFHCQTTLVQSFRTIYPGEFSFEGNRAMLFSVRDEIPEEPLRHCIALALTYHRIAAESGNG
jgi:hypothetical protein